MMDNAIGKVEANESQSAFSETQGFSVPHGFEEAGASIFPERLLKAAPSVTALREDLVNHRLYATVESLPQLRLFMEQHVFAVWDFMSLTKRLQRDLTCVELPWMPAKDAALARFINEIVHCEESDEGLDGTPASHLELYLGAMQEVGADTAPFRTFMKALENGETLEIALAKADAPEHVKTFVTRTIDIAMHSSQVTVAADFLYGREDIIPDMFQRILEQWGKEDGSAKIFRYYLERHIEVDGDDHGPMGRKMLETLAGESDASWQQAAEAAMAAIEARIALWDGLYTSLARA